MDAEGTLGELLDREIASRGLNQTEAGQLLGKVSQATVSRWIMGTSVPKSRQWTAIARFLKLPREEVAAMVIEARLGDPDTWMLELEERFDRLESKVDLLIATLGQPASRGRRGGR